MKNVQISQEIFFALMKYFMLGQKELQTEIQKGLEEKFDAMVMRDLYTKYKSASIKEEKQKACREYLDRRGIPESFRW
ncbi:MAG: complexin-2 [Blautia sp.]|nr:complexin-2 [Blautia sp.]MCM1200113.1 complexin-2 [Bacteroides fragilis]